MCQEKLWPQTQYYIFYGASIEWGHLLSETPFNKVGLETPYKLCCVIDIRLKDGRL